MKTNSLLTLIILLISNFSIAQEELIPLYVNPEIQNLQNSFKKSSKDTVIILLDTVSIPFVDDFSQDKIKSASTYNVSRLIDSVYVLFRVNGKYLDTLIYNSDTTYSYTYNSVSQSFDSTPNPILQVDYYEGDYNFETITKSKIVWSNRYFRTDTTGIDTLYRLPDDTLINDSINVYFLPDNGDSTLWVNYGVFRNSSMAIDPPTIGYVTFDGISKYGVPYDLSTSNTYGKADYLVSKPIQLNVPSSDSLYLSFYYQMGGRGDLPEEDDSLSLDFFSPITKKWRNVWNTSIDTVIEFKKVFIPITDTIFLQTGFQFRFRNYATLSGSFDLWHIDYVELNSNRSRKEELVDVGFRERPISFLGELSSMPWNHYVNSRSNFTSKDIIVSLNNLSNSAKIFQSEYEVFDSQGTSILSSAQVNQPYAPNENPPPLSAKAKSSFNIIHSINKSPNSFLFPKSNNKSENFEIKFKVSTTPDDNSDNDEVSVNQYFDSYYSYDDGSAELAYTINGAGSKLACEFEVSESDTLKAILINFPTMISDMSDRRIRLMVWKDLNEDPIYESSLQPPVINTQNNFHRYAIKDNIVLSGNYFIGYEQQKDKKLYIGWDVNALASNKVFYNTSGNWFNSIYQGNIMIRPDFGNANLLQAGIEKNNDEGEIQIFPNPSNGILNVNFPNSDLVNTIKIFGVDGQLIYSNLSSKSLQIDLSNYTNGIYLFHIYNSSYSFTDKIILK